MSDSEGRLVDNILYFCRALRRAGLPIGTAQVQDTLRAVQTVGFSQRRDFQTTLRACLVTRPEHLKVFDEVFILFWRDPEFLETFIGSLLPMLQTQETPTKPKDAEARAAEAMAGALPKDMAQVPQDELSLDARFSMSQSEKLGSMDFEQMSAHEVQEAERAIAELSLNLPEKPSRRSRTSSLAKRVDQKATLSAARRLGGEVMSLKYRAPRKRVPNLVILCDISGSMTTYSRMMMHFIHALSLARGRGWAQVYGFTFGTRLSNITRALSAHDIDAALRVVGQLVEDWDGGTKIGQSLSEFNRVWARRVLHGHSVILLVTDGLERSDTHELEREITRLRRMCTDLIWLNPLLRFDGFEPRAAGIRAILPHVDRFVACHSLNALRDLTKMLTASATAPQGRLLRAAP